MWMQPAQASLELLFPKIFDFFMWRETDHEVTKIYFWLTFCNWYEVTSVTAQWVVVLFHIQA
jgi:hypothetical protein